MNDLKHVGSDGADGGTIVGRWSTWGTCDDVPEEAVLSLETTSPSPVTHLTKRLDCPLDFVVFLPTLIEMREIVHVQVRRWNRHVTSRPPSHTFPTFHLSHVARPFPLSPPLFCRLASVVTRSVQSSGRYVPGRPCRRRCRSREDLAAVSRSHALTLGPRFPHVGRFRRAWNRSGRRVLRRERASARQDQRLLQRGDRGTLRPQGCPRRPGTVLTPPRLNPPARPPARAHSLAHSLACSPVRRSRERWTR